MIYCNNNPLARASSRLYLILNAISTPVFPKKAIKALPLSKTFKKMYSGTTDSKITDFLSKSLLSKLSHFPIMLKM